MSRKYTNSCGNCKYFKEEEPSGKGWCPAQKKETHSIYWACENWKHWKNKEE